MVGYTPRWLSLKGNFNSGQTRELLSHRPIRTAPRSMVPAPTKEPLLVIGPYTAAPAGSGEWALAESHQMNSTEARKTAFVAKLRWAQGQPFACVATLGHVACSDIPAVATSLNRCTPRPARVGAAPRGRRHARGSRTRKPDAEQQGGAFDPLSGVGIPPGYINWCIHPPAPQAGEGGGGRPQGRRKSYAEARRTQCRAAGGGGRFRPASRYGYTPGAINWYAHPPPPPPPLLLRLIWICAVCKNLIVSPVAVKELSSDRQYWFSLRYNPYVLSLTTVISKQ